MSFALLSGALWAGCGDPPASDIDASFGLDAAAQRCAVDGDCDDGRICNGVERCAAERCVAGVAPRCDDGLSCTDDRCSEDLGRCVNRPIDADGDGVAAASCLDARGVPLGQDCDDTRADVFPGAAELCDAAGVDEDCDPSTLGGRDVDGDGYIDDACCNAGVCGQDCDDLDRGANPLGAEVCNERDDDCDGRIDELVLSTVYRDADGDGHGDPTTETMACPGRRGYVTRGDDCDDTNVLRSPSLPEICDGIDNDCNGVADPEDSTVVAAWYEDLDGDRFGNPLRSVESCAPVAGYSLLGTDCDDTSAARSPAQVELCNGIDDDCNGLADYRIAAGDTEDDDRDGRVDANCTPMPPPEAGDCDDRDPTTAAGQPEVCDGRDNDCDGRIDEGAGNALLQRDADGDGWGSPTGGVIYACGAWAGYVARSGDCDDTNPLRFPGAAEGCNGRDEDCDGRIDEEGSAPLCPGGEDTMGVCRDGRCRSALRCDAPFADCDLDEGTGCETWLSGDHRNCGACGNVCNASLPNTMSWCDESCRTMCRFGYGDCNDDLPLDGCETSTFGNPLHCGACGVVCNDEPHARGACIEYYCSLECEEGYRDCDGNLGSGGNGCELFGSCP